MKFKFKLLKVAEIDIRIHIFDYIRIYSNIDIRIRIRL